jgi:hypothetical protein
MMIRTILMGLAASSLAGAATGDSFASGGAAEQPPAAEPGRVALDWTIEQSAREGLVQLRLRHRTSRGHSDNSRSYRLAELEGLSPALASGEASGPAAFRLNAEAGTIDCSGSMQSGRGVGECRFAPDARYAAELERRGVGRASAEQMLQLAMGRVSLSVLDELASNRYERPDVDGLVSTGIFGIDSAYIREMAATGYRVGSVERLVEFRIHGVSPEFVRGMAELGYSDIPADRLVEFRIHGVSPELVRGMAELGYRDLEPQQLVEFRIFGVTPAFVRELQASGLRPASARELVELRMFGRHGRRD